MGVFQAVTLTWKGQEHTVEPDKVMGLIAQIEDVITLSELYAKKGPPLAKVSMAYGAALRYAGCKVRDDEIYASLFQDSNTAIPQMVTGLLAMMLPPQHLQEPAPAEPSGKKRRAAKRS